MGRTGKLFAYEHYGIEPDILTLAKSLAGGVPIGALLMKKGSRRVLGPGIMPPPSEEILLATAAGVAALTALLEEGMLENCRKVGDYFLSRLEEMKKRFSFIKEVRGKGLILGMELKMDGGPSLKR